MRKLIILLALALSTLASPALAQSPQWTRLRTAIPTPDADGFSITYADRIFDLIRADLIMSNAVALVDPGTFIEKDVDISLVPNFNAWTTLNARYVVVGKVKRSDADGLAIQFRVYDPFAGRQVHAGQVLAAGPAEWEDAAHSAAQEILRNLTRRS
jgi:Tol biopolymer transport system component